MNAFLVALWTWQISLLDTFIYGTSQSTFKIWKRFLSLSEQILLNKLIVFQWEFCGEVCGGEVCFRYKKHPMAVLASFFMKREKVVEGTVCQNAYSFHIELTELCTHSVLSTGTQDCRLPYTWRKNLSICTGISYNTSLNPIVQFCITLYSIIFPSCLANEIYFSRLCTSKTYPNLLKTVQTKK